MFSYSKVLRGLASLGVPAIAATVGRLAHDDIDASRPLGGNDEIKQILENNFPGVPLPAKLRGSELLASRKSELKDKTSLISSATSAIAIGVTSLDLLATLIEDGRKLSLKQGVAIFAVCLPAAAGAIYSMVNWDVEHVTETSAYGAAASVLLINTANCMTSFFARKNEREESRALLSARSEAESVARLV